MESKLNYWDKVYDGNPGYYGDVQNPSRVEIARHIAPGDTVLDAGCGIGALKALLPNNEYTGFDYSPRAIRIAVKQGEKGGTFMVADARQMSRLFNDNEFDVVVMRHFLENQEDWKETIRQAFRIANKKVIINMRRPFSSTRLLESPDDTFVWDMDYLEFNGVCRSLSTNVSFGKVQDEEFIIIGKHLDKVIFDLDDMCPELDPMPVLLPLKEKYPKLKVSLFCIVSKCPDEWIKEQQAKYGDWVEYCLHGDLHDTIHGRAQEANYWTTEEANAYLDKCEAKGIYKKVFRPPGWGINIETYKVLIARGYRICEHLGHDRWPELGGERYTTGHLMEVHGHTWECNGNGVQELATTKRSFDEHTEFLFVSEAPLGMENYLPNRYQ